MKFLWQIQKKAFNKLDFAAAGLMCVGLMVFMLADNKVRATSSFTIVDTP